MLEIPDSVTKINAYAFYNAANIKELTLPERLMTVGDRAFEKCIGIKKAVMPVSAISSVPKENLKVAVITGGGDLEDGSFSGCSALTDIELQGVVNIGKNAFDGCSNLTEIEIPQSVKSIGAHAFYGCANIGRVYIDDIAAWCGIEFADAYSTPLANSSALYLDGALLTRVEIPASVVKIGNYAFYYCNNLTELIVADGVESIGENAFYGCGGLKKIVIPESVTDFGQNVFKYCSAIEQAEIHASAIRFVPKDSLKEVAITGGESIGKEAFDSCKKLETVKIGDSLLSIGEHAFYGCTALAEVTFGTGVGAVGAYAFYGCNALNRVDIADADAWSGIVFADYTANPLYYAKNLYLDGQLLSELTVSSDLDKIGDYAFYKYDKLSRVVLGDGVNIGKFAFYGCNNLTAAKLGVGLNEIGNYAFGNCVLISEIDIPSGVKSIAEGAFSGCGALENVSFGQGTMTVGANAFEGCEKLTGVYIRDIRSWCETEFYDMTSTPLYYADNLYFNGAILTELSVPVGTAEIGRYAFYCCDAIESVSIPNSVQSVGEYAFMNCTGLAEVFMPEGVLSIGDGAFRDCSGLMSAFIPDSATNIGSAAFYNCTSLNNLKIGKGITDIQAYTFYNCPLEEVSASASVLYELPKTKLKSVSVTSGNYIDENALKNCINLESISIGGSITGIGMNAFEGCSAISAVYITDIAAWCGINFSNIASNPLSNSAVLYLDGVLLTELDIPDGTTAVKNFAFAHCGSIQSVRIADSVASIGMNAFDGCVNLKTIEMGSGVAEAGEYAFRNCTALTGVYFTDISKWCAISFSDYDLSPLYYAQNVYIDGQLAENLIIPQGVNVIGNYAFANCVCIESVSFSEGVTEIGAYAFADCTGIAEVTVPASVSLIGKSAFKNCGNVSKVCISDLALWCGTVFSDYMSNPLCYGASIYVDGEALTALVIPEGVAQIGDYAFYKCGGITRVEFHAGVTEIGVYAFYGCGDLVSAVFADTVGWKCYGPASTVDMSTETLSDALKAAEYLKNYNADYRWQKEDNV